MTKQKKRNNRANSTERREIDVRKIFRSAWRIADQLGGQAFSFIAAIERGPSRASASSDAEFQEQSSSAMTLADDLAEAYCDRTGEEAFQAMQAALLQVTSLPEERRKLSYGAEVAVAAQALSGLIETQLSRFSAEADLAQASDTVFA